MHGLSTIHQLNELAVQNAKGAPEDALRRADAVRAARGDKPFNQQVDEILEARRQAAIQRVDEELKEARQQIAAGIVEAAVKHEDPAPYVSEPAKVSLLGTRSAKWLLDYVGGLEHPTALEQALALKLAAVQKELEHTAKRLSVFID